MANAYGDSGRKIRIELKHATSEGHICSAKKASPDKNMREFLIEEVPHYGIAGLAEREAEGATFKDPYWNLPKLPGHLETLTRPKR